MKYLALVICCLLLAGQMGAEPSKMQSQHLFFIARSKNANIVRYDVRLDQNGGIAREKPVDAYWILLAKDGSREELSAFDKKAYGYKCTAGDGSNSYKLVVESFSKRPIKLYVDGKIAHAEIIINGKPAYLSKIFISATSTMLIPKVHSIELFGKDKSAGAEVYEKIKV
jgi:hypothetical protein